MTTHLIKVLCEDCEKEFMSDKDRFANYCEECKKKFDKRIEVNK